MYSCTKILSCKISNTILSQWAQLSTYHKHCITYANSMIVKKQGAGCISILIRPQITTSTNNNIYSTCVVYRDNGHKHAVALHNYSPQSEVRNGINTGLTSLCHTWLSDWKIWLEWAPLCKSLCICFYSQILIWCVYFIQHLINI